MLKPAISPTFESIRFEEGDRLLLFRTSIVDGGAGHLFLSILQDDGTVKTQIEQFPALVALFPSSIIINTGAGWLLSASVKTTGSFPAGQFYATLSRLNGGINTNPNRLTFAGGYIAGPTGLNYPADGNQPPDQAQLQVTNLTITAPGAGNDFSLTVDPSITDEIIGLSTTLVTDANVANRTIRLTLGPDPDVFLTLDSPTTIAASQAATIVIAKFGYQPTEVANQRIYFAIPEDLEFAALFLNLETTNIQAGDAYSDGVFLTKRRPTTTTM